MSFNYQKIRKLAHIEARQTQYYKTLTKRNFKRCTNYADYKIVASDIATHLMCAKTGIAMKAKGSDPAFIGMLHSAFLAWDNPNFPVYAIERDLAEALLNTVPPTHVCKINKMFDIALFLLPSNLIKNPDGLWCEWILVSQMKPEEMPSINKKYQAFLSSITGINKERIIVETGLNPNDNKLRWASTLQGTYSYANVMALPENSDRPISGNLITNGLSSIDLEAEANFTNQINSLVLQTLLYMQLPKEERIAVADGTVTSKHHQQGFDTRSPQSFIWIGFDKQKAKVRKQHLGGNHASPITHWRTGHWRTVGETDNRRLTWVRPTIVNG